MRKLLVVALVVSPAACGPGEESSSGTDSATDSATTTGESTTGSTGDSGSGSGSDTTGGVACEGGDPGSFSLTIDPGTWPSEEGVDVDYTDYTVDTSCTISAYTPGTGTFEVGLSCSDSAAQVHTITMSATLQPGDLPPGLSEGDTVEFRFIRDSWHDVTMYGGADWVSISEDGVLVFAGMDGRAEFLGFTPAEIDDFWSPLTLGFGEYCTDDRQQLDVELAGTHRLVPDGESGSLVTAEGEYAAIVGEMSSQDQGPEYPSVSTRRIAVVRTGG